MKCQRCQRSEARYRVYTDILNLKVCMSCVIEALEWELRLKSSLDCEPINSKSSWRSIKTADCSASASVRQIPITKGDFRQYTLLDVTATCESPH